ncbi:MAG: hypothetical protein B6D45_09850 [Ignavibacteriales bacterium UTCHB3]|nr:MAG: hypothetical protein B6D45_09850 [Ignavibacteriales bacterium UTCHB3]
MNFFWIVGGNAGNLRLFRILCNWFKIRIVGGEYLPLFSCYCTQYQFLRKTTIKLTHVVIDQFQKEFIRAKTHEKLRENNGVINKHRHRDELKQKPA